MKRVRIGGTPVDLISINDLFEKLDQFVLVGKSHYVCFCDAHLCVRAHKERHIKDIMDNASLVLPDGVSMTIGARLLGKNVPDRLPGPVVMIKYCEHGVRSGLKHFFYGGGPGIAEKLAENLHRKIPGLNVAGTFSPPFRPLSESEEIEVKEIIEKSKTDVLWIGLGAPKQELWMAEHVGKINVPLMMGVGAAFDFHSGNIKWAPLWIRKSGLEWVYRMFTGGKRVFIRNAKFESLYTYIILKQVVEQRIFRRETGG